MSDVFKTVGLMKNGIKRYHTAPIECLESGEQNTLHEWGIKLSESLGLSRVTCTQSVCRSASTGKSWRGVHFRKVEVMG